tara:strand:- start:1615 stop:3003 length:1389 start_codon:yes stop_codon:yes gene_type:complete
MSKIELIMPKMGESVAEATIIKWVKNIGDSIELDETIVEIATDKVDSEIPSIAKGVLIEQKYKENDVVQVGEVIAIIEDNTNTKADKHIEAVEQDTTKIQSLNENIKQEIIEKNKSNIELPAETKGERFWREIQEKGSITRTKQPTTNQTFNLFLSPLVKSIVQKENISQKELQQINGSGKNERITKRDIITYVENRISGNTQLESKTTTPIMQDSIPSMQQQTYSSDVEIVEMDRMRKLIAKHMIQSKAISAHVTSFVEADVSKIVEWRNRIKNKFQSRENEKITYTPIMFESIIKSIIDFPLINISVDGDNIIKHKHIHLGMATALTNGNLIVPVIRNAQEKNILGLTKSVNNLAKRARENQLKPDEVMGGTFTVTNVGSFGSIMGTPIINQPQVAILALGKIQKKPTVIETDFGDTIGIRSKMFLSLSYDHRVIDGALGSQFLKKIADYLESFDTSREI